MPVLPFVLIPVILEPPSIYAIIYEVEEKLFTHPQPTSVTLSHRADKGSYF